MSTITNDNTGDRGSNQDNRENSAINNRHIADLTQSISEMIVLIDKMGSQAEEFAEKYKLDQITEQFDNLSMLLKNNLNSTSQVLQNLDSEWQANIQKIDLYKQKLSDSATSGLGKALWGALTFDKSTMEAGFNEAKSAVVTYTDEMANTVNQSLKSVDKAASSIWDNIKNGARDISGFFKGIFKRPKKADKRATSSETLKSQQFDEPGKGKSKLTQIGNAKSRQAQNKERRTELKFAKRIASEKNKIIQSAAKQKTKIIKNEEKKQHTEVVENINNGLSASKTMVNKLSDMFSQYYSIRSQAIDIQYNLEKKRILDSQMNEEEKKKALDELEADTHNKRKQLAKEQAKTNKTVGIITAVIDTALAIVSALKAGWPQCIAFAAAAAAQGAAQIAVIKAQQIPALASGGIVTSKGLALVGEEGPELITLPEAASVIPLNRPHLSAAVSGGYGTVSKNSSPKNTNIYQIGTLIGDDLSLKKLTRKISDIQTSENKRKGLS